MLASRLAAVAAVAAVLVTVTACAGSSSGASSHPGSTTSSSAGTFTAKTSDVSTSHNPSFVNGGSALADSGHLIYVLEAVNPKIGTNKADLIAKSKALCAHVDAKESESQLETAATKGFTNGSWVPSHLEAQAIVGTVKAYAGC